MPADPKFGQNARRQFLAAHALAGFGTANLQKVRRTRFPAKIVIERHDSVHLGAGQIKRFGDEPHGGGADTTELFLQTMQNRKHGAFKPGMFGNNFLGALGVPGADFRHACATHISCTL
jgi:hypothetical protein